MEVEKPVEEKKEEANFQILSNPSRVLEKQVKHITFLDDNRYRPLLPDRKRGIALLVDQKPGDGEDDYLDLKSGPIDEVKAPADFVFDEEAHKQMIAKSAESK
jgi:hypothetical protein